MKLQCITTSRVSASSAVSAICALAMVACGGGGGGSGVSPMAQQTTTGFADTPLVVDKAEVVAVSATVDANLQNPWGIAVAPGLPF
jgi:hypothetical protein